MTEPIDESEMASDQGSTEPATAPDQTPTEPATEPATATGAVPPAGWGSPSADPAPGWVQPPSDRGGGGLRRGCVIALLVVAVGVLAVLLSLIFLGSQLVSSLEGTIQFGTGGAGCSVTGGATTFPSGSAIHSAAFLERDTRAGETITTMVTYPNGTSESNDRVFDDSGKCITEDVEPGLEPGHYGLEYRAGTEVLAKGEFDITP